MTETPEYYERLAAVHPRAGGAGRSLPTMIELLDLLGN